MKSWWASSATVAAVTTSVSKPRVLDTPEVGVRVSPGGSILSHACVTYKTLQNWWIKSLKVEWLTDQMTNWLKVDWLFAWLI